MRMKRLREEISVFLQNRMYVILLLLVAVGGYGFKLMHPTIGIDDTPYEYYFSDGLAVVVGRWVLFLLNRFLDIGDYAPFLTDFAGVLLLLAAVTIWSAVCRRIFGQAIPMWGYLAFACLFISNPLISEVFTYFLHNGVAIGYTFSGLAIWAFMEGLEKEKLLGGLGDWAVSALCIWVAIGCYESFAVVFLVGALLVLFARRLTGQQDKPVASVFWLGVILVVAIVLRSLMTNLMIAGFSLEGLRDEADQRSLGELIAWITDPEGRAEMTMALKRLLVMYGVFAYHYMPIAMYVAACVIFVVYGLFSTVRRRDLWLTVYMIGVFVAAWILIFIEGKVTVYRACQFLPLFCAFSFLLLFYAGRRWLGGQSRAEGAVCREKTVAAIKIVAALAAAVLIWNQTADLNNWFYVDYRKYEYSKETMNRIAWELEENYDTSKPLVFIGVFDTPMELIQDAYVPIGSETFFKMNRITQMIDPHLLEKYYRRNHIWVAQTPSLSVIGWGMSAFDGNQELIKFMEMHGHSFVGVEGEAYIREVALVHQDMPVWPAEGSIKEEEEYIVINFGF